ncbi:unnamed protein product [Hydatigera taeniaeformis]|uniref:Uncharacterized protein n=1 Tax=Hydatigena taeniaeformis TaxID=6205 RepID=A0A0R3WPU8_HYDTA|nr:unnamed protein product [Hydatigera taeniaeformis]
MKDAMGSSTSCILNGPLNFAAISFDIVLSDIIAAMLATLTSLLCGYYPYLPIEITEIAVYLKHLPTPLGISASISAKN